MYFLLNMGIFQPAMLVYRRVIGQGGWYMIYLGGANKISHSAGFYVGHAKPNYYVVT